MLRGAISLSQLAGEGWRLQSETLERQGGISSISDLKMKQHCDTIQRVQNPLKRLLDERGYQLKKAKGIILLEGIY